jgi:hypothetical protein
MLLPKAHSFLAKVSFCERLEYGFRGFMGVKETAVRWGGGGGQEVIYVAHDQSEAMSASEISKWYERHVHTQAGMLLRFTSVLLGLGTGKVRRGRQNESGTKKIRNK